MDRKEALRLITTGVIGVNAGLPVALSNTPNTQKKLNGNIKHSACRWCYGAIDLDRLCQDAMRIGLTGIDLLKPSEIDTVQLYDLTCTMVNPEEFSLTDGFNDVSLHASLQNTYSDLIDTVADKGLKNIICFSGNRKGLSDQKGRDACAKGLEPLVKKASDMGVVIHMELLNSKVDHVDYQCDHTEWGVQLCDLIGSEHFKLLYDIYHMQIMEGDIIATIRKYHSYFGHYHTGGVPGRNEIDKTQELFYPAIMEAIVATGFMGYVAQEFIPTAANPVESLENSITICDV